MLTNLTPLERELMEIIVDCLSQLDFTDEPELLTRIEKIVARFSGQ